jgi:hypothetical protein
MADFLRAPKPCIGIVHLLDHPAGRELAVTEQVRVTLRDRANPGDHLEKWRMAP